MKLELPMLMSATFVRLGQEALNTRDYAAVEQSMASLQRIETQLPSVATDIRPRISVQNRLRDFVAEASRSGMPPQGCLMCCVVLRNRGRGIGVAIFEGSDQRRVHDVL